MYILYIYKRPILLYPSNRNSYSYVITSYLITHASKLVAVEPKDFPHEVILKHMSLEKNTQKSEFICIAKCMAIDRAISHFKTHIVS